MRFLSDIGIAAVRFPSRCRRPHSAFRPVVGRHVLLRLAVLGLQGGFRHRRFPVPDLSGGIAVAGGKYTVTPMSNLGNGVSVIAVINDVCNLFLVFS